VGIEVGIRWVREDGDGLVRVRSIRSLLCFSSSSFGLADHTVTHRSEIVMCDFSKGLELVNTHDLSELIRNFRKSYLRTSEL
jgi:hypothetical protein